MNTWIKRGLQTALLTGGLLATGAGIASASEGVDVTVPVTVTDNTLAVLGDTGATDIVLPAVSGDIVIDLGAVGVAVPITIGGNTATVADTTATQPAAPVGASPTDTGGGIDVTVPVVISGNGVGVLGDATGATTSTPTTPADGNDGGLDVNVPVVVAGNGVGVLGDASGTSPAPSSSTPTADGNGGGLDVTVPVTVCGNGVGVLGDASGTCTTPSAPTTGTTGGGVDVTVPVIVCGNGVGVLGDASGTCTTPATTTGDPIPLSTVGTAVPPIDTLAPVTGPNLNAATRAPLAQTAATDNSNNGTLAYTGASTRTALLAGLLALLLGFGLTAGARRRETQH